MTTSIDIYDDARHHAKGGKWYPNAENYPACILLLHEDDVSDGDSTWTDRINGMVVTAGTSFTKDADGVAAGGGATVTDTFTPTGTKDFVLVSQVLAPTANASVALGNDYNGQGIKVNGAASGQVGFEYSNFVASDTLSPAPTYPISMCNTLHADLSANDALKFAADGDSYSGKSTKAAGGIGTINQTWTGFSADIVLPINTGRGRLVACFAFTMPPTDVEAATEWMGANPGKLYPGWAGKT